jgi:predicted TIM-barrel fold metal-dependent hydrolase
VERTGIAHVDDAMTDTPDAASRAAAIHVEMDQAGIDLSCLLLGDYGLALGEGDRSIEEENSLALDLAGQDPRLVAFFGIDPRRPTAAELFENALERGAKGLKLHPTVGFLPSDRECYPLYELAAQYGVPVATHTGPMAGPLRSAPADPIHIDAAAADFPGVNFVLLHAGQRAWFEAALDLAQWKSNLYLEISQWQRLLLEDETTFVRRLASIRSVIGLDRVLFGSDFPGLASLMSLSDWAGAFRGLPEAARRHGLTIKECDVDAVLGGTAARLLGIKPKAAS